MSHDFSITRKSNDKYACFFGYADGITYKAFNAQNYNAGVSGSFGGRDISHSKALIGIQQIIDEIKTNYPDPTRAKDLEEFLNNEIKSVDESEIYSIHYS